MELTKNTVAELDTAYLTKQATAIRDAVVTKSVTAEMVGKLFVALIEACGNVRDALALFLDTNVAEITTDIDTRLAGVDDATAAATAETQKSAAMRALVEELVAKLSSQNLSQPTRIEVTEYPKTVTLSNAQRPQIKAKALPAFGFGSLLFLGDNNVLAVTPDGRITPIKAGTGYVHVVCSTASSIYRTLAIAVVPPHIRLAAADAIRVDGNGNIRLT